MDVSASIIIHNSTAKVIKYRQVEITPIMMDPVRREQQMQDVRNAILQICFFLFSSGAILFNISAYSIVAFIQTAIGPAALEAL